MTDSDNKNNAKRMIVNLRKLFAEDGSFMYVVNIVTDGFSSYNIVTRIGEGVRGIHLRDDPFDAPSSQEIDEAFAKGDDELFELRMLPDKNTTALPKKLLIDPSVCDPDNPTVQASTGLIVFDDPDICGSVRGWIHYSIETIAKIRF